MTPFYPIPDHEYHTTDFSKFIVNAIYFNSTPSSKLTEDSGVYCTQLEQFRWEVTVPPGTIVKFRTTHISNPNRTSSQVRLTCYTKATKLFKKGKFDVYIDPFNREALNKIHITEQPQ